MELNEYIDHLDKTGKVCLKGKYWDHAFTIATKSKERNNSILPNPLILSGWNYSDDNEKRERFRQHLRYSYDNKTWTDLIHYIESLSLDAWHIK